MSRLGVTLIALAAACAPPPAPPAGWRPGDEIVVPDDPFSAQVFAIDAVAGDKVQATLFGSQRTFARADVWPVVDLAAGCPPGEIVLVGVTRNLWDVALALGSDGESCFV